MWGAADMDLSSPAAGDQWLHAGSLELIPNILCFCAKI